MIPKRIFEIAVILFAAWFFLFSLKFWAGLGLGIALGFWEGFPVGRKG